LRGGEIVTVERTTQPKRQQVIKVTVKLVEAGSHNFHFDLDHLIAKDKEKVLLRFRIHPPHVVVHRFAYEVGRILDENKTWRQEGVKSGATLLFGTEEQVGA
jgi:hypothetical protein